MKAMRPPGMGDRTPRIRAGAGTGVIGGEDEERPWRR